MPIEHHADKESHKDLGLLTLEQDQKDFWLLSYFGGWSYLTGGTGSTWRGWFRTRTYTGTTASSTAKVYVMHYRGAAFGFKYDNNFWWHTVFAPLGFSGSNGKTYLKIDTNTDPSDPTDSAVGFRVDNNALKGIVHNGTALTAVDLGITLTANVIYRLAIKFTAGSKIEWYVNGVKKGESASIPSGTKSNTYFSLSVKNGDDTADQKAAMGRIAFWQDW